MGFGKKKVIEEVASAVGGSYTMPDPLTLAGGVALIAAGAAAYKIATAGVDDEPGESDVVQQRRVSLSKRRASIDYTPEEEAILFANEKLAAREIAKQYTKNVNYGNVTTKYDAYITNANNGLAATILDNSMSEDWSESTNTKNIKVSTVDDVQFKGTVKCGVPAHKVAAYLEDNICLGGHECEVYRTVEIATVDIPVSAPVTSGVEGPEPVILGTAKGHIRRFKANTGSMAGFGGKKRDYVVITVTYKIPAIEGGDGTYVVLTTSIPDDDVVDLLSPDSKGADGGRGSLEIGEHDASSPLSEQIPQRDLVFGQDDDGDTPTTTGTSSNSTSLTPLATPKARSPVRLRGSIVDGGSMKKKLGSAKGTERGLISYSGFYIEATDSSIDCNVHFACKSSSSGLDKAEEKLAVPVGKLLNTLMTKFQGSKVTDDSEMTTLKTALAQQVRRVSGEVVREKAQKSPEQLADEMRERDEAAYAALMTTDPVKPELIDTGIDVAYTALLNLHDYLDLPRDFLADHAFKHNCPADVRKPRRRRMSVMQKVGLEAVPDTDEFMVKVHRPREMAPLKFEIKAQRDGVIVRQCPVPGTDWQVIKAQSLLKVSKKEFMKLILAAHRVHEYDDMLDEGVMVARCSPYTVMRHMKFKPIWPTTARDFLAVSTWEGDMFDMHPAMMCSRSAPDECQMPTDSHVRGKINVNGYLIEPFECIEPNSFSETARDCKVDKNDFGPGHIRITFINHVELNGSLPASVLAQLAVNAPISLMRKLENLLIKDRTTRR